MTSHPLAAGASTNDGIDKELCSLSYTSVDARAQKILEVGHGTLMAKMDIEEDFHVVPALPADHVLLGVKWDSHVYVDKSLPFGLRSVPPIFTTI